MTTVILLTSIVGLLAACIYLWVVSLRLGLRWVKVTEVTRWQIVATTASLMVLQIATVFSTRLFFPTANREQVPFALGELTVHVMIFCAVMTAIFRTRFLQSLRVLLVTLISGAATYLISDFVYRPYVYEAFVGSGNAMAPTMLGKHWTGVCGICGQATYCSPQEELVEFDVMPLMICENFHAMPTFKLEKQVIAADRFFVAKSVKPRRWDLIVYRYPDEPNIKYVHRVVGFPNEEITISDGAVWVNEEKLTPPESIDGVQYLGEIPDDSHTLSGSPERPAKLGADEYFVLGDFTLRSNDSRTWRIGAPDRPPFAVPESHILGVVTHIYWPPSRWRILR